MLEATHDPRFCDCCQGPAAHTPAEVLNRPGLAALSWRVGVFASFRQAMLDAISRDRRLDALTTRASDDMAIAVLEAFAAVGDVLTFYSERLANELYLRTAMERDSVRRLVRLTGYRLRPGLSATVDLAFRLDDGAAVTLRRGLRTMSVPAADELPVFFETLDDLEADAALNAVAVFGLPFAFNGFHPGRDEAPVAGLPEGLVIGDRLVLWGLDRVEEKRVDALPLARDGQRIAFSPPIQADGWWAETARAARVRGRMRFFGHDAPDTYQVYIADSTLPPAERWQQRTVAHGLPAFAPVPLDRVYDDLAPGEALLVDAGQGSTPRLRTAVVTGVSEAPETIGAAGDPVGLRSETVSAITLRETLRGTPATASGRHFARPGAGGLAAMDRNAGADVWSQLAPVATTDPVVIRALARWEVLFRGAAGELRQQTLFVGGGTTASHGGPIASRPAAVAMAAGEIRVFARGLDQQLWTIRVAPAPDAWARLGGVLTSAPAALEPTLGILHVYVRGADRGLWRRVRSGGAWSDWERLRGTLATEPVVASTAFGTADVAATDDGGRLIHRRETASGWGGWTDLGGALVGPPALVAGPNRLDVLALGTDQALWHLARVGDRWGGWTSLGGKLGSPPAADRTGTRIDVIARGADGVLVERALLPSGWSPWQALGDGMPAVHDRRRSRIYRIGADDLRFREHDYPPEATGGAVALRLGPADDAAKLARLLRKRRAILRSGALATSAEVAEAVPFAMRAGDPPDHLRLGLVDPLPQPLPAAELLGNLARASHGETRPAEPLAREAGAIPMRRVRLGSAPLAYLADPKRLEGAPELDLRVGGVRWKPVPSLFGQGADARVFTLRETEEGETEIAFGDGRHGAIPPGDPNGIQATYRVGSGLAGRVKAGQLSVLLEKPPGLRSAGNPCDATGATDPEPRDAARAGAPAQLRAFGRIVSLDDFAAVALATGLVAKAHATWVWQSLERAAHLSVAGPGGARLTAEETALLHAMLDGARLPWRRLTIAGITMIPLTVHARIVPAADTARDVALASARAALEALLAFDALAVGHAVHASAVYAALHEAPGVAAADVDVFNVRGYRDLSPADLAARALTAADLQPQVRIYPARPTPSNPAEVDAFIRAAFEGALPPVLPAEQAQLATPEEDLVLTATEAL
jgi:hypothetical protein